MYPIVSHLNGKIVAENSSPHPTHVVLGENRRTLKVLHAIARGMVILKHTLPSLLSVCYFPIHIVHLFRFGRNLGGRFSMDITELGSWGMARP